MGCLLEEELTRTKDKNSRTSRNARFGSFLLYDSLIFRKCMKLKGVKELNVLICQIYNILLF